MGTVAEATDTITEKLRDGMEALDLSPSGHDAVPHKAKAPSPLRDPWGQNELKQRYPRLSEDVYADVVVVGAGLAGLSTAYRLARAGKKVAVLEARLVGSGTSGRGMGTLTTWIDDTYREVERTAGLERARQVAAAQAAAVGFVQRVVSEEGIQCGLAELPAAVVVDVAEGRDDKRASQLLREELAACCRAGVDGAHIEWQQKEGDVGKAAAGQAAAEETLVLPACLSLHPIQYLTGLAEAVVRHGGQIFENTRAKGGIVSGPSGGVVKTMHGPMAKASLAVVLATHSPINRNQLWVHDRQLPKRVYTVGIEVPKGAVPPHFSHLTALPAPTGWPWGTGLASALGALPALGGGASGGGSPGQVSARLAPLPPHHLLPGEGGGGAGSSYEANKELLLVRGALHHHGHDEKQYGDPWGSLERWARRRFPECGRLLYSWSSVDYYPADLLGLYGRDPLDLWRPPVYVLTGHGGQEWTNATLGSEVVAGAIQGGEAQPEWAGAYRPSRFIPGAAAKYTSELTQYFSTVAVSLLKHVTPRSLADVAGLVAPGTVECAIKPGEGRVAQHGLLKKALYRDAGGTLHLRSALCTHLGCCVEWNPLDKTFDCPCHGSQYDACGGCIHAPAVADLEDLGIRR